MPPHNRAPKPVLQDKGFIGFSQLLLQLRCEIMLDGAVKQPDLLISHRKNHNGPDATTQESNQACAAT